jgi:hypothetical protein
MSRRGARLSSRKKDIMVRDWIALTVDVLSQDLPPQRFDDLCPER